MSRHTSVSGRGGTPQREVSQDRVSQEAGWFSRICALYQPFTGLFELGQGVPDVSHLGGTGHPPL